MVAAWLWPVWWFPVGGLPAPDPGGQEDCRQGQEAQDHQGAGQEIKSESWEQSYPWVQWYSRVNNCSEGKAEMAL